MWLFTINQSISFIQMKKCLLLIFFLGFSHTFARTTTERTTRTTAAEDWELLLNFTILSEISTPTTTEELVTEESLSCTFPDHYCNPTAPDLIRKVEDVTVNSAKECHDLCKRQVPKSLST